jgi:GDPmannose 4,6-dehydratase
VTVHFGDLADSAAMSEVLLAVQPDEIYNLGGISSVAQSWEQPLLTARVTGFGVAGLLEGAWQLHAGGRPVQFVQASSAEIFGDALQSPQNEDTPIKPVNPYGAAKAYAHLLTGVYRARGLGASTCVLYNHESPRRPPTFVTRKITLSAARIALGQQDVLKLGNLDTRRDWGWAPDYVDAMVRVARHPGADDYVIATGELHSVRDLVELAFVSAGVNDWESRVEIDPSFGRPTDAPAQVGDATRARERLGWTPTVRFAEVVARMVAADLDLIRNGQVS